MKHGTLIIVMGIGVLLAGGCRYQARGFGSPEPGERILAATDAARTKDREAIPHLITLLRSDDPLVRMTSLRTLEMITGQTLGYSHAAPQREREEAIRRWVEWYRREHGDGQGAEGEPATDLRF